MLSDEYVVEQSTRFLSTLIPISRLKAALPSQTRKFAKKCWNGHVTVTEHSEQDLLELYCGNGNFTLPLSTRFFRRVLATELAKSSVYAAQWNIEQNQIENTQVARLSAEEFTQAYNGEREFRRLQEANIDLASYDFDTVFVDPPRAGIDDDNLKTPTAF